MVSFPTMGKIGRLGNHLFQIAATIGFAKLHREEYVFPRWIHEKDFPIAGCFFDELPEGPEYKETAFSYQPIPYQSNLRMFGYFQSEKYFAGQEDLIRHLLTPRGVPPFSRYRGTASLHVRRGDYLLLPDHHPILPMDYYTRAMGLLRSAGAGKFLVFSDDLEWCRAHFRGHDIDVVPDMGAIEQLATTIACEFHIMANSTFSWWGAWLDPNPEKIVIAPVAWFGPGYAHFDTKDLIPDGWTRL
jgi:hypothetical protein